MIPSTVERVPQHTAGHINEQIRRQTEENVARYAASGPTAIDVRLAELGQEWGIERTLEANAATAVLVGVTLGAAVDRRFVVDLAGRAAISATCPPLMKATGPAPSGRWKQCAGETGASQCGAFRRACVRSRLARLKEPVGFVPTAHVRRIETCLPQNAGRLVA